MVAMAIFFVAVFAILNLVSTNLKILRTLTVEQPDIGSVASELAMAARTNRDVTEGFLSGDFGDLYPGATWEAQLSAALTNSGRIGRAPGGLYQADVTVKWPKNRLLQEKKLSFWLYLPLGPGGGR
ncbi:MAG: hypothetical protein J7M29_06905 [Verrucomicrobia bacterium]|nr:hypothetical protein [Verrucomicrobiota bacterium]